MDPIPLQLKGFEIGGVATIEMAENIATIEHWIDSQKPHLIMASEAKGKGAFAESRRGTDMDSNFRNANEMPICSALTQMDAPKGFTLEKRWIIANGRTEDHYFFYNETSDMVLCLNSGLWISHLRLPFDNIPGGRITALKKAARSNIAFVDISDPDAKNPLARSQTFMTGKSNSIYNQLSIWYLGNPMGSYDMDDGY